jgi:integrase
MLHYPRYDEGQYVGQSSWAEHAMKGRGKHPDKALTAMQVRNLKQPGRHADGNGLYLVVDPSGAKRWLLRTVVQGKRRDIGLGGLSLISLSEAREKALTYRKLAREGGDPLAEKRKTRVQTPTFAEAAETVFEIRKPTWRNEKHANQWITTLRTYANPHIGTLKVDQVGTPDILRVLSPIWLTKEETATRVRQRIGTIMDWAKSAGFRTGDNPIDGVTMGLPKQKNRDEHHAAMPFAEVPGFIQKLKATDTGEITRLGLEFLILTVARTGEVIGAKWDEVDLGGALWTVAANRMKAGRIHRVPLSGRCVEILERAKELGQGSDYLFPSPASNSSLSDSPLSNMAFLKLLERMEVDVTSHGFRSAFRDWASEVTHFPGEVAEMALAHTIKNKVEAAYRRGDLMEKRREMMQAWAEYAGKCDDK